MRKRPLCLLAAILLLILWILPVDVWLKEPDIPHGEKLLVTGTVTKREQKENSQVYTLKNCLCEQSDSTFSMLAYIQKGVSYPIGCELSLYGTIYQLNKADNPGQFDASMFYQSQGILYTFQTDEILDVEGNVSYREYLTCIREYLAEKLMILYEERDGGILKAILLGDKSSLREEDQLLYQKNGISHLLAISGLHISLIGISMYRFFRKVGLTFLEAGLPSGALLLFYGMLTGFGVSTVRAVCMFLVMIFADILGRAYDMASAMSLAAMILLMKSPLLARQAGFLLSFGAVLGICLVYPVLESVIKPKRKVSKTILFSISLSLVTYPLTVHFFYEYPLYSILLNFIVIPCMPVVMISGASGLFAGCFRAGFGKILGIPAHLVLSFYDFLGSRIMGFPSAVVRLGQEAPWQLIAYYALLLFSLAGLWYARRKIYGLFLPIALLLVTLRFRSGLEFTMLDVGQGDGLFLRFPGAVTCMIDGGSSGVKNVGAYRILPYLKYEGVGKIDYWIITHADQDHISGLMEIMELSGTLEEIPIGTLLFPSIENPDGLYMELWELAEEKGIMVGTIGTGDVIRGDNFSIECKYPVKNSYCTDKNDISTVLSLSYEEFSMLLTGDLGFEGEQNLLRDGLADSVDVWKVSHHGSKYSGSEEFLKVLRPNLSLISVGKNNYGHPNPELLERLNIIGSHIETTLEHGALMLESDGHTYTLTYGR